MSSLVLLVLLHVLASSLAFSPTASPCGGNRQVSSPSFPRARPALRAETKQSERWRMCNPLTSMMVCKYKTLTLETEPGISVWDITPQIKELIKECGMREGFVNVISRHTTTAVMINEYESRLIKDLQSYFLKIAPPDDKYLHNEIHLRPETEEDKRRVLQNNWDINDPNVLEAWRSQEPFNAHSHLLSMMLGNSESIPVQN